MTFLELYDTLMDAELGTEDLTQTFTTARRKAAVNEGQRVFNEHTDCFIKRATVTLVDEQQEVELEATLTDFLWPAKTGASIKVVDDDGDARYIEGEGLRLVEESTLNAIDPNWRAAEPGEPAYLYFRSDSGSHYVGLHPAPSFADNDATWTLLLPYVAQPADMTDSTHEPYGNATPLIRLRPYHRAILHYAAGQLEKLRKNWDGFARHMLIVGLDPRTMTPTGGGYIGKYFSDAKPQGGSTIRLATNYRRSDVQWRPPNPTRWP